MIRLEINPGSGDYMDFEQVSAGEFRVKAYSIETEVEAENIELTFTGWDKECQLVEDPHPLGHIVNPMMPWHVRWQDVDLKIDVCHAPSVERLQEALRHVRINLFDTIVEVN